MAEIIQKAQVSAPQAALFSAFVEPKELRGWLCNHAYTKPQPKGRYWMRWDDGYRVEGHYINVTEPGSLSFAWRTAQAPGQTTVSVALRPISEHDTQVTLSHSGFGVGADWDGYREQCARRWEEALQNLKSVVETGVDLRGIRRPFLGIQWALDEDGNIQVTSVTGGNGADPQALRPQDRLLQLDAQPIWDYTSLVDALEACRPGDAARVRVLREGQECSLSVRLGSVAWQEDLLDPRGIIARVRDRQRAEQERLADTLRGVTEREADLRPAPQSWTVREILAHLSITERDLHHRLYQITMRSWDDRPKGDPAMLPEALAAAMAQADTAPKLLARFVEDQAETLAFFEAQGQDMRQNRAQCRRLAQAMDLSDHTREHVDEVARLLELVRQQARDRRAQETAENDTRRQS